MSVSLPYFNAALLGTPVLVEGSPCSIFGLNCDNANDATVYLQVWDAKATTGIIPGTTAPAFSLAIPAGGLNFSQVNGAPQLSKGAVIAITTEPTNGTAAGDSICITIFVQ